MKSWSMYEIMGVGNPQKPDRSTKLEGFFYASNTRFGETFKTKNDARVKRSEEVNVREWQQLK